MPVTRPTKALTLTAAATFVAGALASWGIGQLADRVVTAADGDITVQASSASGPAYAVVIPPLADPTSVQIPFDGDVLASWASNQGGGPADTAISTISVWANVDHPVRIMGLRADDVSCRPAPAWDYVMPVGGGDVFERAVRINVDSDDLNGVGVEGMLSGKTFTFPLQVSRNDAEYFTVYASAAESSCTFRLSVGYETNGTTRWQAVPLPPTRVVSSVNKVRELRLVEDEGADRMAHLEPV